MTNPDPIAVPLAGCSADDPAPAARALTRARWATRALFAALGVLAGAWGAHIPSVQAAYALDAAMLSTVLLAAASGAVLSLFFAGRVIGRIGVRRAALLSGLVMAAMLALALNWPGLALLLPAMVVFGAAMSLFDVAINAEGTALESLSRRAVMSSLHGMFSVGGMAGAALSSALLRAEVAPPLQLAGVGVLVMAMVGGVSRGMLEAHPHDDAEPMAHFAWPRGLLLVIGLLIFAGMTAEGVMYDWCVLYLKQEVHMPQDRAALGYAVFSAAMALARFGADSLRARYPERWLLFGGALLAALAMAVVLWSGHPGVSLVGYALVGAGLAPVVPILFNAATRVPGTSRAAAIASVSSIGYAGFMIGPPLIGAIAQAASLTAAMSVVVASAALLALGARFVLPKG